MSRFFKYIFIFLFFSNLTFASDLYWVNGSGNWNDPDHWSYSSGGVGGAAIPNLNDDVFIDTRSFTSKNQEIFIKKDAFCNDFNWLKTGFNPIFNGKSKKQLRIGGSLKIEDEINNRFEGDIVFVADDKVGVYSNISFNNDLVFDNELGIYELSSDIITAKNIIIKSGAFRTYSHDLFCSLLNISGTSRRTVEFGSSIVTVDVFNAKKIDNLQFSAGTSTIMFRETISVESLNTHNLSYHLIKLIKQNFNKAASATVTVNHGCNGQNNASVDITVNGGIPNYFFIFRGNAHSGGSNPTYKFENEPWGGPYNLVVIDGSGTVLDTNITLVEPPALIFQIDTNQQITCFGQSDGELEANVTAANIGTPPYTYFWQPTGSIPGDNTTKIISNLGLDEYSVLVTDANGCTYSPTPALLYTPDISITDVSSTNACQGELNGTITITASGGTGALQYSLDNGVIYPYQAGNTFSGLAAGNYEIWVKDANACVKQHSSNQDVSETPQPTANISSDGVVCEGQSYKISVATADEYSSLNWTSSGTGTWQSQTDISPTYTPSADDITAGSVILTLHANGNTPCSEATDNMTLTIDKIPTADAGDDATVCEGDPYTVSTASAANQETILWTHNGTGSLSGETTLAPTYTPGAGETGSVRLTMQVTNPPCSNASDWMDLTFSPAPTANAGSDGNGCVGKDYTISGASATNNSGVNWTSSGTGSFTGGNSLSPTYTPSAADDGAGSVVLTLHSLGNGTCPESTDDMTLTLNPLPGANAGSDGETCSNSTFTPGDASVSNQSTVLWSSSGDGNWQNETSLSPTYTPGSSDISAGSVTLTLTVNGLGSCDPVSDDMILTITPEPTANAGDDKTTCQEIAVSIDNASATQFSSVLWTGTGTGVISNQNTFFPTYTPGLGETGTVTLTLTVNGNGSCAAATDQMEITINPSPNANAGPNDEVCSDATYTLSGASASNYISLLWEAPAGDGSFEDASVLKAVYTPGPTDILNGSVVLRLNAVTAPPCTDVQDEMTLTITTAPSANAGSDAEICEDDTFSPSDASASDYSSLSWTSSGTGSFVGEGTFTPVYTPSAADISNGSVTLTLTALGNGSCNNSVDNMVLTINALPSANAGNDEIICEGNDLTISTATASNYSALAWSTDGTGTFTSGQTTIKPVYSPDAGDIADGSIVLTLTATGLTGCSNASDFMTLSITGAPTANAGNDGEICETDLFTVSTASATNSGGITWETLGTGSFTAGANSLAPTYTPDAGDISNGSVKLILHVAGNGDCLEATDTLDLTIYQSPTVNAGTDSEICSNASFTATEATAANYSSVFWSTALGDGFFDNASNLRATYTPGAGDKTTGSVVLTLYVTANAPCTDITDDITVTITPEPTADAGSDGLICEGSTFTPTDAATSNNASIDWTTSGTGTFQNTNSLFPIYTPSSDDITAGSVVLTIHAIGNGSCAEATDIMTLTIQPNATANAGSDSTICYEDTYTLSEAIATNSSNIQWYTSGDGTFDNANNQNPTYTPGAADQLAGTITLTMEVTGIAPCSVPVQDNMELTIASKLVAAIGTPAPFLISDATEITVSFTADHDKVQDLGFYLVAPDGTTIDLMPAPGPGLCNRGSGANIVNNFTFSTEEVTTFEKCKGGTDAINGYTLEGTWASDSAWDPIYGMNPAAGGWSVQVRDCASGNDGVLTNVHLTFTDGSQIVDYNSGTISETINSTTSGGCVATTYYMETPTISTSCYGSCDANALLSASGGSGNYTITWENHPEFDGQTNVTLCAGTYKAYVEDAVLGCKDSAEVTVIEPAKILLTKDSTNITCNGLNNGTATVTPSNGTAPYVYAWINTSGDTISQVQNVSDLAAGKYYIYVTDDNGDGCTVVDSLSITEPDLISFTNSISPADCGGSNGSITITPSGGTPAAGITPYTYTWSPNVAETDSIAQNLAVGWYYFTITDGSACTHEDSLNMTDLGTLVVTGFDTTSVSSASTCDGTAKVLFANPVGNVTFLWSDGLGTDTTATGLCGGVTYTVTLTDNASCTADSSITLYLPAGLNIISTDSTDVLCNGDNSGSATITVSGGYGLYEYSWVDSASGSQVSTSQTASSLYAGKYYVTVYDNNKADSVMDSIRVAEPTALIANVYTTDANCGSSDGTAWVSDTTGGVSPYTITWQNGLTVSGDTAYSLTLGAYNVTVTDANLCELPLVANVDENSPIVLSLLDSTLISCNGTDDGTALIGIAGATDPIVISWDNGDDSVYADSLNAAVHFVTVTDGTGCSSQISVNITQPDILTSTLLDDTTMNCYGELLDSITVSATGGTKPYSFAWTNGDTDSTTYDLSEGQYFVTITDAHLCEQVDSTTIIYPAELYVSDTVITPTRCPDSLASIIVTPAGGTAPYFIRLYDSDTVQIDSSLVSGIAGFAIFDSLWVDFFGVDITDALGCNILEIYRTTDTSDMVTTIDSIGHLKCADNCDGFARVLVSGGTPSYSYEWSDPASTTDSLVTDLCAGFYIVTVSDNSGCHYVDSVTISDDDVLKADISDFSNSTCFGADDGWAIALGSDGTPFSGSDPYTYSWSDGTTTNDTIVGLSPGTYYVTITDSTGCTAIDSVSITEPGSISVESFVFGISYYPVLCYGDSTGSIKIKPTGGTAPYTILSFNPDSVLIDSVVTDTSYNLTGLIKGKHYYTIIDANGCSFDSTKFIDGYNKIEPTILMDSTQCADSTGSFEITGITGGLPFSGSGIQDYYHYTWTYPTWTGSPDSTNYILDNLWVDFFDLNIEDSLGCSIDTTLEMVDVSNIDFNIIVDSAIYCASECFGVSHIDTLITGGDPWTVPDTSWNYQWYYGQTLIGTNDTIDSLCLDTYRAYVIDSIGCRKVKEFMPTDSSLNAIFDISKNQSCNEFYNGSIEAIAVSGYAPYSFDWYYYDGTPMEVENIITTADTSTVYNLPAGFYYVDITDSNPRGACLYTDTLEVKELDVFEVYLDTITDVLCNGDTTGAITIATRGGLPFGYGYEYTWVFGTDTIPIEDYMNDDTSSTIINLAAGNYTVFVEDQRGSECHLETVYTVDEPAALNPTYVQTETECNSPTGDLTIQLSPTDYILTWSNENFAQDSTQASIHNLGVDWYYIEITENATGCVTHDSVYLEDNSAFDINLDVNEISCWKFSNGSIDVQLNNASLPVVYEWSNGAGDVASIAALDTGYYYVTVTDAQSCIRYDTSYLTRPDTINMVWLDTIPIYCEGYSNGTIEVGGSGGTGLYQLHYRDHDSTISYHYNVPFNDTITAPVFYPATFDIYIWDNLNCPSIDTITYTFPDALSDSIKIRMDVTQASCNYNVSDGAITATITSGGTSPFSYSWSDGGGINPSYSNLPPLYNKYYYVTVSDIYGCYTVDSARVRASTTLDAYALEDTTICFFDSIQLAGTVRAISLTNDTTWVADSVSWFIMDSIINDSIEYPKIPISTSQDFIYKAYKNGCYAVDTVTVTEFDSIYISAEFFDPNDVEIISGSLVELNATGGDLLNTTYLWEPDTFFTTSHDTISPIAQPSENITYKVIATTSYSETQFCAVWDTISVRVLAKVIPPTAFTPNNDGVNDCWDLGNFADYPNAEVIVFNRWGVKIFESKGYTEKWCGKTKSGNDVPIGTYYYIVEFHDELNSKPLKGFITILR